MATEKVKWWQYALIQYLALNKVAKRPILLGADPTMLSIIPGTMLEADSGKRIQVIKTLKTEIKAKNHWSNYESSVLNKKLLFFT